MSPSGILDWFSGGDRPYMSLYHCMNRDVPWVALTVVLDLAVASGYALIALHWWRQQQCAQQNLAHRALGNMKNIFVFCGICGYAFIPIKMFWPAWRLYDFFVMILAFYTWRYAWNARELKVIYDELTRSEELKQDVEALKMESRRKTFFLNSISHDLRTPLNGLMLQAQLAEMTLAETGQDTAADRELMDALASIKAGVKATALMLDGFQEMGRLDWGGDPIQATTFPLTDLLEIVRDSQRNIAEHKGLSLVLEAPMAVTVRTDRMKLERILANLVGNAVKYTREGTIRVSLDVEGDRATITVADTGIGIDPEDLTHIFDEFFQVNNHERDREKGHGLGLSIAARLAELLGGRIDVRSTVGVGSRFVLVLPGIVVGEGRAEAPSLAHR